MRRYYTTKFIGMDVHKNTITIAIAEGTRNGEVRLYGKVNNDMTSLDKFIRKQISTGAELRFVYEAGPLAFSGFSGTHIHIPCDARAIVSPEYAFWFWICL